MDDTAAHDSQPSELDRRGFLRAAGVAAVALAAPVPFLSGCSSTPKRNSKGRTLKIGFVTPSTGALAGFAAADSFVIQGVRRALGEGIDRGGTRHPVEILLRNTSSDSGEATAAAKALVKDDRVDIMLAGNTPEMVIPVSDVCEAAGIPCVTSLAPWQPWFFARGGKADTGFEWTYHYFFGIDEINAVFLDMWSQIETNKVVGALWAADGDGAAFRDAKTGFTPALKKAGYKLIDPGPYANLTTAFFHSQIEAFKAADVQILTGVPLPPDFNRFWKQADKLDFRPKIVSVAKALLFPSSLEALGPLGNGLTAEAWWSPTHPFNSSLTGQSAQELADAYTRTTRRQWTQPIGFVHSLFEVAVDVLSRASDVTDRAAVRDAIASTNLDTIVGPIAWSGRPVRNAAKTFVVGGQWRAAGRNKYDLKIVSNKALPNIPLTGKLGSL